MTNTSNTVSEPISDRELRDLLLQYRRENWKGIQTAEWQEQLVDETVKSPGDEVLHRIAPFHQIEADAQVLDIGSGVGSFVVACRRRGLHAFGIEPDRIGLDAGVTAIQVARRRFSASVFVAGVGENLPFPDQSFDFVVMNQVMEHVTDQLASLREAARVVKKGGAIYIACPNYLRFYEPHYKIFWWPLLPKMLGRLYLRIRGRSSVMLDQLTYTTNRRLRCLFKKLGSEFTFIDLNREEIIRRSSQTSFVSRRSRIVSKIIRSPIVGRAALAAVLFFVQVREGGSEMIVLRRPHSGDQA